MFPLFFLCAASALQPLMMSAAEPAATSREGEPKKILMIGNSLTYTWDIPAILEKFAEETGRELEVTAHVGGGKDLLWHSTTPLKSGLTAPAAIAAGDFDLVILQEYSNILMKPEGRESFSKMVPQYLEAIKAKQADAMLYMAHPTRKEIDQAGIQPIIDAYSAESDAHNLVCAPAALAFVRSNEKHPELALIDQQTDRKYAQNKAATHQSPFGSYLAACTLYAAIYKESPVGLKFHAAFDRRTEIPFEAADALAAQEIAWEIWQAYAKEHPASKP